MSNRIEKIMNKQDQNISQKKQFKFWCISKGAIKEIAILLLIITVIIATLFILLTDR